jgi:CheY-like chemotaxis protein
MDGYEVARSIRDTARFSDIMLIALTGWGTTEDQRRSRRAGFDHHLVKPADINLLQRLLADISRDAEQRPSGSGQH